MRDRRTNLREHSVLSPKRPWKVRYGPDGVHLFDRGTGANVLLNEVSVPVHLWSSAPRSVSVALTNACDLACPHCYAPKSKGLLQFDDVCSWLVELDRNGSLGVGFGGGEPTLFPRFAELCEFGARETEMAITFTTHAHRVTNELAARLRGNVHFIRVSMDGVGSTYELHRGRSFAAFREQLALISSIARFGINFVVNEQTLRDIGRAIEIAVTQGATEFLLLPQRATRFVAGIDPTTMSALRTWIADYTGPVRLAITVDASDGLSTCAPTPKECSDRSYVHIDANRLLKRSSFDSRGVEVGSAGIIAAVAQLTALEEPT